MVRIYPLPVQELTERIRHTLECERWYRERQNLDRPAVQAMKLRDIDGALAALEQLAKLAKGGTEHGQKGMASEDGVQAL